MTLSGNWLRLIADERRDHFECCPTLIIVTDFAYRHLLMNRLSEGAGPVQLAIDDCLVDDSIVIGQPSGSHANHPRPLQQSDLPPSL